MCHFLILASIRTRAVLTNFRNASLHYMLHSTARSQPHSTRLHPMGALQVVTVVTAGLPRGASYCFRHVALATNPRYVYHNSGTHPLVQIAAS